LNSDRGQFKLYIRTYMYDCVETLTFAKDIKKNTVVDNILTLTATATPTSKSTFTAFTISASMSETTAKVRARAKCAIKTTTTTTMCSLNARQIREDKRP